VEQLRADGHHTIIFTNSTNAHMAPPHADNWTEIEGLVLDAQAEWLKKRSS
jgi:hypothetical protein